MRNKQIDWLVFTFFLLIVFFLRLPSFFKSAFGPDEGLYLLMARSLTEGHPPYTVFFDHKPPGIYILFALALLIFGKSVIAIRILACIFVAITCYLLYRLGNIISKNDKKVGLLAGIFYAILSLSNGGLSSNTEIFYTTFVVLAFYLLWDVIANSGQHISQNYLRLFLIGLAMGIGFQIKQVVMFDFIAILMIVGLHMYHHLNSRRSVFAKLCKCYILLGFGLFVPFLTVCLYFLFNGHFADYVYANFTANLARVSDESLAITDFAISFLIQIQSNILLWICLFLTPFYWLSSKDLSEKRNLLYLSIWFFMSFLGICSPKSFLIYYFLQLLPSLCLLSAQIIIKTTWSVTAIGKTRKFLNLALILAIPFLSNIYPYLKDSTKLVYFRQLKGVQNWGDNPAIISQYLRERVNPQNYIYVADYEPIIYYLVSAKIPSKYAFPAFLTQPKLSQVAGIEPIQELQSILQKQPVYIIKVKQKAVQPDQLGMFYTELDRYVKKAYVLEKEFNLNSQVFEVIESDVESVELYRLKNKTVDKGIVNRLHSLMQNALGEVT